MLKKKFTVITALLLTSSVIFTAFGADTGNTANTAVSSVSETAVSAETSVPSEVKAAAYAENNADMQVYLTDFDGLYSINIYGPGENQPGTFYERSLNGSIYALMVNGGFIPSPGLLTSNGTVYISVDKLYELIGGDFSSATNKDNIFTFKIGENTLEINNNSRSITVNGIKMDNDILYTSLYNYNGKDEDIYVPLRQVIEALGGSVEYVSDFVKTFGDGSKGKYDAAVNIVIVEMPSDHEKVYTVEEGLETLIGLSKETYEYVKSYLTETGRTFSDIDPDYDPADIKYIGDMGRYYVYHLKGFESLPLMVNKYTGEVFSGKPGLPFVSISKGFPNIGWLYQ